MTNEELCRKISEARGWKYGSRDDIAPKWPDAFDACWWFEGKPFSDSEVPDWTGSEAASAVLLEEMPQPTVIRAATGNWLCQPRSGSIDFESHEDRKVAIARAWLIWKGIA